RYTGGRVRKRSRIGRGTRRLPVSVGKNSSGPPPDHRWHILTTWTRLPVRLASLAFPGSIRRIDLPEKIRSRRSARALPRWDTQEASGMRLHALCRASLVAAAVLVGAPGLRAAEPLVTNFGLGTIVHPLQEPTVFPYSGYCQCPKEHVY